MPSNQIASRITGHGMESPSILLAHPLNFRRHGRAQVEALQGSLRSLGWIKTVIVNRRSNRIIDGHARVEEAIRQGLDTVPVTYVDLSESEEAIALAVLDPITGLADQDDLALRALLDSVATDDLALRALFDQMIEEALPDIVEPDLPLPPGNAKAGDIFRLDSHLLICGDSTDDAVISRLMHDGPAALVFTDPPYGVAYDGGTKRRAKVQGDETTALYEPACLMAAKYSTKNAALYLWHAGVKGLAAAAAAAAAGYSIRCEIVWNKNQAQFGSLSAQYKQKHEPCYYCVKSTPPLWRGPTNEVTVWDCDRASVNKFHPMQKPPALAARAIRNHTQEGDIVLDLFGGSGSTLIACEETGRAARVSELEPHYCDVIIARWEQLSGKKAVVV